MAGQAQGWEHMGEAADFLEKTEETGHLPFGPTGTDLRETPFRR